MGLFLFSLGIGTVFVFPAMGGFSIGVWGFPRFPYARSMVHSDIPLFAFHYSRVLGGS